MCNMWKENRCGHHTAARTYLRAASGEVNKRYDAAVKTKLLTQGDKTFAGGLWVDKSP